MKQYNITFTREQLLKIINDNMPIAGDIAAGVLAMGTTIDDSDKVVRVHLDYEEGEDGDVRIVQK